MVRLSYSALVATLFLGASLTKADSNNSSMATTNTTTPAESVIEDALMLECTTSQICETVAKTVVEKGATIRQAITSDVVNALSFQLPPARSKENAALQAALAKMEGIKQWPIHRTILELGRDNEETKSLTGETDQTTTPGQDSTQSDKKAQSQRIRVIERRAENNRIPSSWNHLATQIDKLHSEGFTGNNVKIAIVDTGINYNLPVFGNCYRKEGCRVTAGDSFQKDGKKGGPLDCQGHGTWVASILAGYDPEKGFVGVAPNATIMPYKATEECSSAQWDEDVLVAAWSKAKQDGAQIIVSSTGFEGQNWAQSLLARTVSRFVAEGVHCIVAMGNDRDKGLFNAMSPSTGRGVVSVNSVRQVKTFDEKAVYSLGNSTRPVEISMFGQLWLPDDKDWPVHDVDADFSDDVCKGSEPHERKRDDGQQLPRVYDQDLVGKVALMRLKDDWSCPCCLLEKRGRNAIGRGARHVVIWDDKPKRTYFPSPKGMKIIAVAESKDGQAMAHALAANKPVTIRFTAETKPQQLQMGFRSAFGPTWDLDIKPHVLAPGDEVPVVNKQGILSKDSGTSFAAPLVAGAFALIGEARGKLEDPALLNGLIVSTAKPLQDLEGNFFSVAEQGGGLLQAWDAARATTLVEPSSLAFNDTDHRVSTINMRINNTGDKEIKYRISSFAAITTYTFQEGSSTPGKPEKINAKVNIKLSQDALTLGPGQSATINVSATDPQGLNASRLPLWSGWVKIEDESIGTTLTIPYLGLTGSLQSTRIVDPKSIVKEALQFGYNPPKWSEKANFLLPGPEDGQPSPTAATIDAEQRKTIDFGFKLLVGSPQIRVEVVPLNVCSSKIANASQQACVPESLVTDVNGFKSIGQVPRFPQFWASPHYISELKPYRFAGLTSNWNGTVMSGKYAPPGHYKLVIQALSIMGDAENKEHWQITESPEFSLAYENNII